MSRPGLHMLAEEVVILQRWLAHHDMPGVHDYDVHLTVPDPVWPASYTEEDKANWRYLSMKRVDLVIRQPAARWLIEVTPRQSTRALGAVIMYKALLEKSEGPNPPISLGVVCEIADPALGPVYRDAGITVWVV